ncbi:MAG: hypothetical protein EA398_16290, partial [Deltaproteobacteria bacterium]
MSPKPPLLRLLGTMAWVLLIAFVPGVAAAQVVLDADSRVLDPVTGEPLAPALAGGEGACVQFSKGTSGLNSVATALTLLNADPGTSPRFTYDVDGEPVDPTFFAILDTLDLTRGNGANTLGDVGFDQLLPWTSSAPQITSGSCQSQGGPLGADRVAVRMRGNISVDEPGIWTFSIQSDDGYRLSIGNTLVSQFNGNRSPARDTVRVVFPAAGQYPFEVIYWENSGVAMFELLYTPREYTFVSSSNAAPADPLDSGSDLSSTTSTAFIAEDFERVDSRLLGLPTWSDSALPEWNGESYPNCSDLVGEPNDICVLDDEDAVCGNGIINALPNDLAQECDTKALAGASCPPGFDGERFCNNDPDYADGDSTCTLVPAAETCTECLPGFFGPSCEPCACVNGDCDDGITGTGACICDTEWTGPLCETCPDGFFVAGGDCIACPGIDNCTGQITCTTVDNATCDQCAPGHAGTGTGACTLCEDGSFEQGGVCVDCPTVDNCAGDVSCNVVDGTSPVCDLCEDGFFGTGTDTCTACSAIDNCTGQVTCTTADDATCDQCAPGHAGTGTGTCTL